MRVAVVSDIHGNLHALEAVLAAVDADPVGELWCLGDTVGYGPKPNECCAIVAARASVSLCGNHDLGVLGRIDLAEFSGDAAVAASWTRGVLTAESRDWLSALEPRGERDGVALFHGSARDPVWEYVLTDEAAVATLLLTTEPLVLVGHSHAALNVALRGSELEAGLSPEGTVLGLGEARWLLNPGSVGQPRDGDPRAAYLVLDLDARTAAFRRVPYDVERTQSEIRAAELPEVLAARLDVGQ
jgi:diadenosine tetraphosphatase ApaH/serine/threonine PP2A family protein phosphatase